MIHFYCHVRQSTCVIKEKNFIHRNNKLSQISVFNFLRLPFNWKTPSGFAIAFTFYTAVSYTLLFSFVPIAILFIGTFILFISFIKNILNDLQQFKELRKKSQKNKRMRLFCNIIQDFSSIKQLSIPFVLLSILTHLSYISLNYFFYADFLVLLMILLSSALLFCLHGHFFPFAACF